MSKGQDVNDEDASARRSVEDLCDNFDELWRAYYERLVKFARARLDTLPRRDADEEDIALSAMKSFYRGWNSGRFPKLSDPDDLWKILLTIAGRKANKRIRYQTAAKRGAGAVRGESAFERNNGGHNDARGIDQVIAEEPTPEEAERVISQCQEMLDLLDEDSLVRIAMLKLEGYSNSEIAERLGCAERTVERKLYRVRLKWEHLLVE